MTLDQYGKLLPSAEEGVGEKLDGLVFKQDEDHEPSEERTLEQEPR